MNRLVSGIKPTGELTLGNYIGAIKQFVQLQNELPDTEFFIFIADLHAITTPQDKQLLKSRIKEIAAFYIACGLDPNRVNLFVQSEVMEHALLGYIMESTAYIGEMERMIQFKEKRRNQEQGVRTSLLTYPALMAADILLYDANIVPVGEDQVQHLELTQTLAERFNSQYGDTFVVPKPYITKVGAKIKDLQDPTKKMSKSNDLSVKSYILLSDNLNQIKNKIKSAVTDSDTSIYFDEVNKPGISNLLTIYSALTNLSIEEIVEKYKNETSYAGFKIDLAEIVASHIGNIQTKYNELIASNTLDEILDQGAMKAKMFASRKMAKVLNKIGLKRKK
ncbi:tryptophan--tRNA ligase [Acholeplasma granularum]|uniref:tryptophan--tRNA ligase n=1 Tax=Acholeplasma granularum TaxID=264635 RepID=UPI000471F265|nr:tryptophan--tRNA ligase [Acholeplasma granularum]